ncbi:hypothetical protein [Streptomyces pseudovenezuelae]|uniref:Anti-sigma factor n=1 Tax=Streptomyces pseudovenezuelae TaxID=67350 RepID=A0ABT6LEZ3_9ACTN|nr:hypothetical protein [Streptomyces pseudovenezuelae]MDH6214877.1 hypothetical protein [Streptomyces pseudovenezuelae]
MNDDELLARLKSADPALTPEAPLPDIDRLVEATLTSDTAFSSATTPAGATAGTTPRPAKTTAGRGRRQFLGLAAAGLLLLGGGIAGGIMANNGSGNGSGNGNGVGHSAKAAAPLTLTAEAGGATGKCVEPTPDLLRKYPTLFGGTVTSVKGSAVTFRVDYWLKGGDAGTVVLDSGSDDVERLTFSVGESYIVAAKDGVVPMCGANSASPETIAEFRQAFGK